MQGVMKVSAVVGMVLAMAVAGTARGQIGAAKVSAPPPVYDGAQAALGPKAASMAVKAPAVYDVATVKANKTLSGMMSISGVGAAYNATNASLKNLLQNAYDIREDLIAGLPGWAESAHYDIVAKATEADPNAMKKLTDDQSRAMLRQLLEERFHIRAHIEVKTLSVFELVKVPGGIKFKPFVASEADPGGNMNVNFQNHNLALTAHGITMANFADSLSDTVERTVLDRTGLPGMYELKLRWLDNDAPAGGDDAAPPIYTALQEQLGLKLAPSKGPVETLVIDSISQPEEN